MSKIGALFYGWTRDLALRAIRRKLSIDTLTIVAGPAASGKSVLIENIMKSAELRERLRIPSVIDVKINALRVHRLFPKPHGHVVFHYNTLRPFFQGLNSYQHDPALSIILSAKTVIVIDIVTARERLLSHLSERGARRAKGVDQRLYKLYSSPDFLEQQREQWLRYCMDIVRPHQHIIVENNGEYRYSISILDTRYSTTPFD
jgi:hypothetical protein